LIRSLARGSLESFLTMSVSDFLDLLPGLPEKKIRADGGSENGRESGPVLLTEA